VKDAARLSDAVCGRQWPSEAGQCFFIHAPDAGLQVYEKRTHTHGHAIHWQTLGHDRKIHTSCTKTWQAKPPSLLCVCACLLSRAALLLLMVHFVCVCVFWWLFP
jgi:hypothetical protein